MAENGNGTNGNGIFGRTGIALIAAAGVSFALFLGLRTWDRVEQNNDRAVRNETDIEWLIRLRNRPELPRQ